MQALGVWSLQMCHGHAISREDAQQLLGRLLQSFKMMHLCKWHSISGPEPTAGGARMKRLRGRKQLDKAKPLVVSGSA